MARATSAIEIRDALDEAVRCLAISAHSLPDRLHASSTVLLGRLSRGDFSEKEDRELFDRIDASRRRLRAEAEADRLQYAVDRMPEGKCERLASNIVDLRDTVMGRAIRDAGGDARRRPHPRHGVDSHGADW
jgi:hypothetical protein